MRPRPALPSKNQVSATAKRPTRGSAADVGVRPGVRPTLYTDTRRWETIRHYASARPARQCFERSTLVGAIVMERILIRHLSGARAGEGDDFPATVNEILIGRDPDAAVCFDPSREDLVSRQHVKIVRDPE